MPHLPDTRTTNSLALDDAGIPPPLKIVKHWVVISEKLAVALARTLNFPSRGLPETYPIGEDYSKQP